MKRYARIIAATSLLTITPLVTLSLAVEDDSRPMASETELRYFDVTTLKYGEEPDLGIPEEYQVPVEAAFELAEVFREGRQDFDTGGEFTGDYVIAYDFSYDYYEYGFILVDAEQGELDLEYVVNNKYELTKGDIKRLYFVSADKRGEFRVHKDSKRGLPSVMGFMRYSFDEAANSLLGGNGITNVVFSSRPSSIIGVVVIESDDKRLFIERWKGFNYYINEEAFKASKIYKKVIKGNLEPLDESENVQLWNDFEVALEKGDIPRDVLAE